jgi:hypothetical protein
MSTRRNTDVVGTELAVRGGLRNAGAEVGVALGAIQRNSVSSVMQVGRRSQCNLVERACDAGQRACGLTDRFLVMN